MRREVTKLNISMNLKNKAYSPGFQVQTGLSVQQNVLVDEREIYIKMNYPRDSLGFQQSQAFFG
jgi:hypothetical protein